MRLDSNDYPVHPAVIGRRLEVVADLERVKVFNDGTTVADHERVWARHQTITDPDHLQAAKVLRRTRVGALRPVRDTDAEIAVEQRALVDYDTALALVPPVPSGGGTGSHDRSSASHRHPAYRLAPC